MIPFPSHTVQAMAYLGKADELLRWSSELRGLQLPRLPTSLIYPWQLVSKASVPGAYNDPSPADSQRSNAEIPEDQQHDGGALTSAQEPVAEPLSSSHHNSSDSTCTDSGRRLANQGVTDPLEGSESGSTASDTDRQEKGKETEQDAAHAEHIWSSWLRWQHRWVSISLPAWTCMGWIDCRSSSSV